MDKKTSFASIDDYIASYPAPIQKQLQTVRAAILAAAPKAQEKISYQMPAFTLNGNLVYFAVFKKHIGFFGASTADPALNQQLAVYANEKGSLKFPLDKPIPVALIKKIVKLRVAENKARTALKASQKK